MAAITAAATPAIGDEHYPDRLVRIVVPYTAGTGTDLAARVLAEHLGQRWSAPVIVENEPGASGSIGTMKMLQSPADGYTVLLTGESLLSVYMKENPPYDPLKDIAPVSEIATLPFAFIARKDFPAKNFADFVKYARDHPNQVTISTPGYGTPHQILMELLTRELGLKLYHIPYVGAAGAMQDVVGGHVDVTFSPVSVVAPLRTLGIQVLAAGGMQRTSAMPDVPCFAELGVTSLAHSDSWNGAFVAASTPAALVQKIATDLKAVLDNPQTQSQMHKLGFGDASVTPKEFAQLTVETAVKWKQILTEVRERRKEP